MGGMRCLRGPETRVSCCKHAVRQYYMPTMDGMDIHSNGCWVCGGPSCFETLRADSALVLACFPHQALAHVFQKKCGLKRRDPFHI